MSETQRLLVFRAVPKPIAAYIQRKNNYHHTPIKAYEDAQGDIDLTVEVHKDQYGKVREYVHGLIDGYYLANLPE